MRKICQYKDAVKLRSAGYSYSYIKNKIGVSKSTLSIWLAGLPYKRNVETLDKISRARLAANMAQRKKKQQSIRDAESLAISDVGTFTKRDLFILGIGIYIGEGSKTGHIIRVTNSDPKIIVTMIFWFKRIFHLQNSNFSIRIHLYPDTDQDRALGFWSKMTRLPKSCFLKSFVDRRTNKKKSNHGKLPYGTAHLTIKSGGKKELGSFFFRRITSLMDIVHRNAGVV